MKKTYIIPSLKTAALTPSVALLNSSVNGWDNDDTAPIIDDPGNPSDFDANGRRGGFWGDVW